MEGEKMESGNAVVCYMLFLDNMTEKKFNKFLLRQQKTPAKPGFFIY